MSAEERWAQRLEWAQERGEIEIKKRWMIPDEDGERCDVQSCLGIATTGIEVGRVEAHGGAKFSFCRNHNDDEFAFEFYERMRGERHK